MNLQILKKFTNTFSVLLLLLMWWWLSSSGLVGKTLIATPEEVITTIINAFKSDATIYEKFHIHAFHTIKRALEGWIYAILGGVFLGAIVGHFRYLYNGFEPIVEFFRSIPPVLIFPLLLVAFNFEEKAYIWSIFVGCIPVMLLTVARATLNISEERLNILKLYKVKKNIHFFVICMEILPSVFLGARITLSIAIIISVVTEMVFTPASGLAIGSLARDAEMAFDTALFYTSTLTIGIFGYFSNLVLRKIEEKLG